MKQHQGVWLPEGEEHLVAWMTSSGEMVDGRGTYQIKKLRAALEYVKEFRCAVDVGAHCGLWSMQLAKRFDQVIAFEPVAEFRQCFEKNVDMSKVSLVACALGERAGKVTMSFDPKSSGNTHIVRGSSDGAIDLCRMDDMVDGPVDFIKIDVEGSELDVVKGAERVIMENKPVIIVEQKPHVLERNYGIKGAPAVAWLVERGAKVVEEISGDFILTWDSQK